MKKLVLMMAAMCAGLAWADPVALGFFSLGPDAYADGSAVKEGEFYALVWVKGDQQFAGFDAKGALADAANGEILAMGPWAAAWTDAGVGCEPHNIQPDAEVAAKYADGSIRLYLLDTRTATGALAGSVTAADGSVLPARVNGFGEVSNAKYSLRSNVSVFPAVGETAVASKASAVPAGTKQPRITSFTVKDGYAYLTVSNTEPCLQYAVAAGEKPEALAAASAASETQDGVANKELTFKVPLTDSAKFFQVNRPALNTTK